MYRVIRAIDAAVGGSHRPCHLAADDGRIGSECIAGETHEILDAIDHPVVVMVLVHRLAWGVGGLPCGEAADCGHHDAAGAGRVKERWLVGGIVGALLTGVFNDPSLGGPGFVTDWVTAKTGFTSIGAQVWVQAKAVGIVVVWSAVVTAASLFVIKLVMGLRVAEEDEREGLDVTSHGEKAYN